MALQARLSNSGVDGIVQFTPNDSCTMTSYADDLKLYAHSGPALSALFEITQRYLACFGMTTAADKGHVLQVGGSRVRSIEV